MTVLSNLTRVSLVVSLVSGCAVSQEKFIQTADSLDDTKVCRNYLSDMDNLLSASCCTGADNEQLYFRMLKEQVDKRNLSEAQCKILVKKANDEIVVGIIAGVAIIGAAAAASSQYQGYGSNYNSYSGGYGYAWDQFYGSYGTLTWRCRDKSNGQFASNYLCSGYKNDYTWPAK